MTDKIRARGLAKNFDKFKPGPNDFAIKKGFVTGFIGKNGMGLNISFGLGINFLVFVIIICLQYPIYFNYGYAKAKTWILLPIFIIGIIGMIAGFFIKDFERVVNSIYQNKELIIIFSILLLILIIAISFKLAVKFYKKKRLLRFALKS